MLSASDPENRSCDIVIFGIGTACTYLETGESDGLSSTSSSVKVPVGRCGGLVDQVETDGQVNSLGDTGSRENIAGSDTGLLKDNGSLDGTCGHDDFEAGIDGVGVGLFVTELETGGTGSGATRKDELSDIGSGKD